MKIARIEYSSAPVTAVVVGDGVRPLPGVEVLDLLAAEADERERLAAQADEELALAGVRLLAPVQPASIRDFSVFEQHVEGTGKVIYGEAAEVPAAWYERPAFYFSNPHSVTGPDVDIAAPPGSDRLDLELEVAVVISRPASNVSPQAARDCIGGFTIFNDWSARDFSQLEARLPFGFHKAKDFANTLGPWIVTPDELERYRDDAHYDLSLRAFINGKPLGEDSLANMAWSFAELVAFSARGSIVAPGDVIGSGTCGYGCLFELWGRNGSLDDPPPLQPGDEVRLEAEGIGTLTNRIVAQEHDPPPLPSATPGLRRRGVGLRT
jgi:2-keto-4-pentenoate hydratase/2-oxohepta-3-ene-1,7-dioic acid hydratase in catechol pathway